MFILALYIHYSPSEFPTAHIQYLSSQMSAGVTSYKVDLESKMVVVTGDIVPLEVLESVSKVKNAELWTSSKAGETW